MSATGLFPAEEDGWVLADRMTPEGPEMIRFRTYKPTPQEQELFSYLVVARWSYEATNSSGLPEPDGEEQTSMEEFEDRFTEVSDRDASWGTIMAVITHNNQREWRFYTPDVEEFQAEFSKALAGFGPYPLEFEVFEDPEWIGLSELRDNAS